MRDQPERPAAIAGVDHPGPFAVGVYAARLRAWLRERARVQLFGEVVNLRLSRTKAFFELRDGGGALPCSMWRDAYERSGVELRDGLQVVVAGGLDFYAGSQASSPHFSFAVSAVRVAGEGDLLAQLEQLRRTLHAEGLFAPQKALPRPLLPRTIGVVTGEGGKARDDVLAGLQRRGWSGRVVWAFAPVQDRHAAPRITRALQDLAAVEDVEVVVVARGGGSLADLFAFCDETLCRTVALLRVPVVASVGHHTDRTLIDDVAAVSCSTPTHAAEAAVPLHCTEARARVLEQARCLARHGRRAVPLRARTLALLARRPGEHLRRERERLARAVAAMDDAAARRVGAERTRVARLRDGGGRRGRGDQRAGGARGGRRAADLRGRGGGRGGAGVSEQGQTYETATARLEAIIARLDSGEAGLRETLSLVAEGRELVAFCAAELDAVGKGLEELRLEELVARLEEPRA